MTPTSLPGQTIVFVRPNGEVWRLSGHVDGAPVYHVMGTSGIVSRPPYSRLNAHPLPDDAVEVWPR